MKNIGLYRKAFPRISETFITEPAYKLVRYRPTFIACTLLSKSNDQTISISQTDLWGLKQTLYLLTRSPQLFGRLPALKKLDLIHGHFGPDGVYAMALAKKLKIPFIVTFHGWDITINRSPIWKIKSPLYYQLLWHEEELKQKASVFIAVSKFIRGKLLEQGYPQDKVIQHYIGIDTAQFTPGTGESSERYILCVGRHTEKKGIDTLLRAFARIAVKHPTVSLLQIGTGSLTAELQSLAKQLGIAQQVRFLGSQPYKVVQNLMRGAEIFALASQTASNGNCEGLPFVILEALACGLPIASTWHSGIPEAVLEGETGFLAPERDNVALAEKLDVLLSDRALAQKMGHRGREFVCEFFDIRKQTAKLEDIYDSVIAPKPDLNYA